MASGYIVRKNQYYDSVFLMGVNKRLSRSVGVRQTAVLMGSENNKRLLAEIGIVGKGIDAAQANDLIVAVLADSPEMVRSVLDGLDEALLALEATTTASELHTFEDGLSEKPNANLAVLTIPGEYIYREARKALEAGLNVFIFSSNVPLEQERELKGFAQDRGLLVMGPDCGTSILNGVGVGFANVVRRGSIGAIGSSGTGLQEFTSQIHNAGFGVSHAIGTGSRDLSDEIGGITTLMALEGLESDPGTEVIAIIAKPPGSDTFERLTTRLQACSKPVVACLLGSPVGELPAGEGVVWARTIDAAVQATIQRPRRVDLQRVDHLSIEERAQAKRLRATWSSRQGYLRGLFAGGSFCYQSQQILRDAGLTVYSNAPLESRYKLPDPDRSREHSLIDLGDDRYTLGRPHPMIDSTLRRQRILTESQDPDVGVVLLDFILGYNAAMDPVGEVLDAILEARSLSRKRGRDVIFVASICGTKEDPQDLSLQSKLLQDAGVHVFSSNAKAASFCAALLKGD